MPKPPDMTTLDAERVLRERAVSLGLDADRIVDALTGDEGKGGLVAAVALYGDESNWPAPMVTVARERFAA